MIRVASTTASSINIEWDELAEKYRKGVITSHLIEYMRVSDRKMFSHVVSGTARSYLISGKISLGNSWLKGNFWIQVFILCWYYAELLKNDLVMSGFKIHQKPFSATVGFMEQIQNFF